MKVYYKFICLFILIFSLIGCNNKQNNIDNNLKSSTDDKIENNNTNNTEENNIIKSSMADYDNTMNIIDDNYRMYYEVFVYSFCDSDGDGIGDLKGLISKLDYIEDLGCNGIWLMPIMPSTTYHKYDVIDYYNIDEQYGTLDDFKLLIKECDKRNIRIIIDMVFNHTSSKNEWFIEATNYLKTLDKGQKPDINECPYVSYYNFQNEDKNKDGYYNVEGTDWYYEGVFWSEMPDLNLENESVRKELESITKYWLDLGVSGFRLDAAKEYFSGNGDKNIEVLNWYTNYVKSQKKDAYLVAEVWDSFDTISRYYRSGIDSIFNYTFGNYDGQIVKALNTSGNGSAGSKIAANTIIVQDKFKEENPNMIDAPFLSNHDTGRIAGFVGYDENKIKLAGAMNVLMGGSAFLYYGEELGMTGSGIDENKRAPMYWSEDNSKLTTPPPNMEVIEHKFGTYEEQKEDVFSIYSYYKKAICLRNKYSQIARGDIKVMDSVIEQDGDIFAISKTYKDKTIYLIYNLYNEQKQIKVDKNEYKYDDISDSLCVDENEAKLEEDTISIPAYGVVILKED